MLRRREASGNDRQSSVQAAHGLLPEVLPSIPMCKQAQTVSRTKEVFFRDK